VFRDAGGVNVKEDGKRVETWKDEELYISGQTVVWSRTGQDGVRSVLKTFTMDSPVLQVDKIVGCLNKPCITTLRNEEDMRFIQATCEIEMLAYLPLLQLSPVFNSHLSYVTMSI
jgi:hypothetical protein